MLPLMYLICHFVADYLSFLLSLCFYEMHNEGADIARSAPPHRLTRPTGKLDPDCMVGASLAPTALSDYKRSTKRDESREPSCFGFECIRTSHYPYEDGEKLAKVTS